MGVVVEFVERGRSRRSIERLELQRMLESIQDRPADVHKIDRLARNRADDAAIPQNHPEHGAYLVSAWSQGTHGDADPEDGADDPLIGAVGGAKETVSNTTHEQGSGRSKDSPRARRRREHPGPSVRVHRGAVWAKTK